MQPRALLAALLAMAGTACASAPRAGGEVDLVVAATTDVHGWMRGWDYYRGVPDSARGLARAATIVDSLRASAPGRVLLVDAGDLLQGTPLTFLAARADSSVPHPVIAAMNAMRYDAAAIGNHEFNYGLPALERAVARADFPFLAANAYRADGSRAFPAFRIVERAGVRVGIVGATTPGSMVWDAANLRGRLVLRDIVPAVRGAVNEARAAGADVIVVVMHSGLDERATYDTVATGLPSENVAARVAREVRGIDLLVYGHSHKEMADTIIGSTLLVQPRFWAASVSAAHLVLARTSGAWRVVRRRATLVPAAGHAESPEVVRLVDRVHRAALAYVETPIGSTPVAWRADSARVADTPIIDFILEVERRATGADLASASAFDLGATLGPGPITIAQIARLYPYENTLAAVRVSGRQLREYLEQSARYFRSVGAPGATRFVVDTAIAGYNFDVLAGADYVLDLTRPIGSRVASLTVKGKPVADAETFTLALNNYRQSGGGGYSMLQGAPVVHARDQAIRQLLIDEVSRRGTIRPSDYFARNWSIAPAAAVTELLPLTRTRFDSPSPSARDASRRASGARPTTLRIIATNDIHGTLLPAPDSTGTSVGGIARVATMIERLRAECRPPACASIWLDGGDIMQGSTASNAAYGRPMIEIFNRLGADAAAVGNHEFDWGLDTLRARVREARFPILAANVRRADGAALPWLPGDTLIERAGLRIGLIGLTTPDTPTRTKPWGVEDLRFLDLAPVVDERARALRARGADIVIVLGHIAARCGPQGDSPSCTGYAIGMAEHLTQRIDAIVSGDSHTLVHGFAHGIPIVQALSRGAAVGVIDLPLAKDEGEPRVSFHMVRPDSVPADPAIDSIVRRATDAVRASMERRIAVLAEPFPKAGPQFAAGNLVADAMRARAKADVALINNGGVRTGLPAGAVTFGQLFDLHPFGNQVIRIELTGAALRAWAEAFVRRGRPEVHVSGIVVRYDSLAPQGERVVAITTTGGRAIDPAATYTVALPDFVLAGGDRLAPPTAPASRTTIDATVLDAVVGYLQSQPSPVRTPRGDRFIDTRRSH
jgi:2',3'-cyclic-nucleotide 2'-phosphodiesterase/3'-nucleotidase/5'-nucleotidase